MSERKELGKIQSVRVGSGGYQDAMWGVWMTLGGGGWGVSDGRGTWATRDKHAKYSEQERRDAVADAFLWAADVCAQAGKSYIPDLVGTPVECTFDGMTLKSWRVLAEVL